MSELPLSPQVFAIFNALFEERAGISYSTQDKDLVASKVSTRALDRGFESALDYYYFLRYDQNESHTELDALVESLVVHETFFFREYDQLLHVVDAFIVPAVRKNGRARLWSAACSTGEEPLSLAMMLADRGVLDRVDIVASDVSAAALARARSGRHGRRAVRADLPAHATRQLEMRGDEWFVPKALVDAVEWRRLNLMDREAIAGLGIFDVVLCRNVLFYFRDDTARRVVADLAARLTDDGALFVGVAESLLRLSTNLVCEEQGGVFLYRNPRPSERGQR